MPTPALERITQAWSAYEQRKIARALELVKASLESARPGLDRNVALEALSLLDGLEEYGADAAQLSKLRERAEELAATAPARAGSGDHTDGEDVDGDVESVVEPFETSNPWLQQLFGLPSYGRVPANAIALLREVSPDPDEHLLAAIKSEHGRMRRGYLLATTKALRWIRTFPSRDHDAWGYEWKLEYRGISITKAVLILGTGDQFQTYRTRAKPFAEMYRLMQEAMAWESSQANELALGAITASPPASISLAEEISRLAELHAAGILSPEEFAAAKKKLLG